VPRPIKELKGFAKVHLAAGENRKVSIALDDRAFAFFDVAASQWRIEAGAFQISTGFSATDLRAVSKVERAAALLAV
jgi:beta-glucosidase